MAFLKFSLLFLSVVITNVYASPSLDECFQHDFSLQVKHKVKPFGMFKNILYVTKDNCVITITLNKYKYFNKKWIIDVCREPIHIKYGVRSVDVLKRVSRCLQKKTSYCKNYDQLIQVLEDDGLIFADGNRNDINSKHGEVFCSFELIKAYLGEGTLFGDGPVQKRVITESSAVKNEIGIKTETKTETKTKTRKETIGN